MRRFLLVVNVLIAIVILAAAGVYYWFFYRPLPAASGTVETFVSQPVTVDRDALGVPHVKAKTLDDAWFTQGYTTAEDRMFQMDGLRRLASGQLSEIIGAGALESDRDSRRLRMRRVAEQIYAQMPDADKAEMAAYARGVNAYIESHRGRYTFEFTLLGYDPRPWTVVDSLLAGLQMFRTLTNDWKNKLIKQKMLAGGEPDKVNYLFPFRSGFEVMPGADEHPGSNAWAIAGSRSATGKPLLSNDMHLEYSEPGVWYLDHLEAPGLNVSGVALPGVPGIVSGHNDRIAWGMTNLGFDVQDLYIEKIDLRNGRYLYKGNVEQGRAEREVITIKNHAPEEMTIWVTRHGPVIVDENGAAMSLRWTAEDPGVLQSIFPEVNQARNWEEFRHALSRFGGPGQNFVYADVDGNIGYQATGKLPIRPDFFGDVPLDGASGEKEWSGYIPFEDLPTSFNPPSGLIVTANQNPFPPDYKYHVSGFFDSHYRSRQILDMLSAAGKKLKPEDSLRVQKDVYSGLNKLVAQQLVKAYDEHKSGNASFDEAIALLRTWDGQMDQDRPEPLIADLSYQYLRKAIAERAAPGSGNIYEIHLSSAVTERVLRERPAGWFSSYNELLLRCFSDAMDEARRMQGTNVKRWRWGKYRYLEIDHPVGSRLPLAKNYFDIGPVPMSGSATTVKQTTARLGPSERMDASPGDWDASLMEIPIGQSGNVASSHYRDQWPSYYYGTSFPMQFKNVKVKSTV
ncbi:MAG TPA: penicillin acylase family protein, partial [Bryobacteraceae bacterium]|nr:penicillin acylase family protein [Bryobacteraceae bacterium]